MQPTQIRQGDTPRATSFPPVRPRRIGRHRALAVAVTVATVLTTGVLYHEAERPSLPSHAVNAQDLTKDGGALGPAASVGTDENGVAAIDGQAARPTALEIDAAAATARLHDRQQEGEAERGRASVPNVVPPISFSNSSGGD